MSNRDTEPIVRPSVVKAALLMESVLRSHDSNKGTAGWKVCTPDDMVEKLYEEVQEAFKALEGGGVAKMSNVQREHFATELIDVMNVCMMILDCMNMLFTGWNQDSLQSAFMHEFIFTPKGETMDDIRSKLTRDIKSLGNRAKQMADKGDYKQAYELSVMRDTVVEILEMLT